MTTKVGNKHKNHSGRAVIKRKDPPVETKPDEPPVKRKDPPQPIYKQPKKPRAGLKEFRVVVRNLPFATTSEELKEYFEKLGTVKDIQLPKCKDPRFPKSCAGFAFIQYGGRNAAREAVEKLNFSTFKGRKIAVDWTLDKDEYITKNQTLSGSDERKRMLEKAEKFLKKKPKDEEIEIKKEEEENDEENEGSEYSEMSDEDISGDELDIKKEEESTDEEESKPVKKFERKPDTAVEEERVLFLRNLSFDTTNESLKEHVSKFGDVTLTIMCKFAGTEQPTGNAFVHFKEKESADKCLEELDISGIFIDDRIVEGHRAVPREEASKFEKKEKQGKDKRNLKFLKVSKVRPGTTQAKNISEEDSALRKRLVNAAKTKLKNLHMFVSTKRLAIHNIPFSYRDNQLYELCMQNATKNANITFCRIMRAKKGKDKNGHVLLGKSKGFAFVEFTEHLDALTCLRNLNNNPEAFTDKKRPIVEFSIENMRALKIQEKRRQQRN